MHEPSHFTTGATVSINLSCFLCIEISAGIAAKCNKSKVRALIDISCKHCASISDIKATNKHLNITRIPCQLISSIDVYLGFAW